MKIKKLKIRDIYLFFLGFLGFSMLGQFILLNVFHFPFSFMELYYLPLLFKYRNELASCIKKVFFHPSFKMFILGFILVCGILMGCVETLNFSIIINYRTIIYMILIIEYVNMYGIAINLDTVYLINFAAILGDFAFINIFSNSDITSSINCVAIALAVFSAFLNERYTLGGLAASIGVLNGITSGFRLGIVVSFLIIVEALVFTIVRNDNWSARKVLLKRLGILFAVIGFVSVAIVNYESIISFVATKMGMSNFAIYRVTERMKGLLSLDFTKSQDTARLSIFQYPIQRFIRCIIPRGLIGESIGEYWLYIDVPILYLYDLFGSVCACAILIHCIYLTCRHIKFVFYKVADWKIILATLMMPVLLLLEIVNGTFVVVLFQGIETAFILGIHFSKLRKARHARQCKLCE